MMAHQVAQIILRCETADESKHLGKYHAKGAFPINLTKIGLCCDYGAIICVNSAKWSE